MGCPQWSPGVENRRRRWRRPVPGSWRYGRTARPGLGKRIASRRRVRWRCPWNRWGSRRSRPAGRGRRHRSARRRCRHRQGSTRSPPRIRRVRRSNRRRKTTQAVLLPRPQDRNRPRPGLPVARPQPQSEPRPAREREGRRRRRRRRHHRTRTTKGRRERKPGFITTSTAPSRSVPMERWMSNGTMMRFSGW